MSKFIENLVRGYKIMFNDAKEGVMEHGPKIFTGVGTGLMTIGSALIARDSCKAEVQQAIAEANALVEHEINTKPKTPNDKPKRRILKAKFKRGWKIIKIYKRGFIVDAIGSVCNGIGIGLSEKGRHKAIAGAAAIGGVLANYRAAVVADLGPEADIKYLNGQKVVNIKKKGKKNEDAEDTGGTEDGGLKITKDPSAFRLLYSRENTPSVWSENYDMRLSNLDWIQASLSRLYMNTWETGGSLTLNDMRGEFDGYNPKRLHVDIGNIFGRKYDPDKPETHKLVNLHYQDDEDFMSGRKDSCWIYFDCDPEPIVGRKQKKPRFKKVET